MIQSYRHAGLKRFFETGSKAGIDPKLAFRLRRRLLVLDAASSPEGMNVPGFRLHPLKGERQDEWSISVTGNWRMTFWFEGKDVCGVNLEDYH